MSLKAFLSVKRSYKLLDEEKRYFLLNVLAYLNFFNLNLVGMAMCLFLGLYPLCNPLVKKLSSQLQLETSNKNLF